MTITIHPDEKVLFPAFTIRGKNKTELREFVAEHGLLWLEHQKTQGVKGCVMVDIDDTLIDGRELVHNGFQFMEHLYHTANRWFPIHVVTARPDDDKENVIDLLHKRNFMVDPDRLHCLPAHLYGRSTRHVEEFKFGKFQELTKLHDLVVARFGDKLWDSAHISSLDTYLSHVRDKECYIYWDPQMPGTLSAKLPG